MAWEDLASSYDTVAARYETQFVDELTAKPLDRALLDAFARAGSGPVVDLGCGPGQVGRYVAQRGRQVIGVDLSPRMAALAAARLGAAVVADLRRLPFATGSLGGAVAFYSLIHLRRHELSAAAGEMARVLRSGAALVVSVHGGEGELHREEFLGVPVPFVASLFRVEEITNALSKAGLSVTTVETRAPYDGEHPTTRIYVGAGKP